MDNQSNEKLLSPFSTKATSPTVAISSKAAPENQLTPPSTFKNCSWLFREIHLLACVLTERELVLRMDDRDYRLRRLIEEQIQRNGYESIRVAVRTTRKRAGITQRDLSEATGINVSAIGRWETGQTQFEVPDLVKIWSALFQIREARRKWPLSVISDGTQRT